ncbi:MAG: transposase [Thermomicrobiales bacterium]|nr:integrase core domain-containing protein [Sphingobium indicum]
MLLGECPQALLTILYCSTDCRCRAGAPIKDLAHSASFHSWPNNAPSNPGTKHLIESFNARLRDECLNETLITSLGNARQVLADWRHDYNHFRPHSTLGNRTPAKMGAGSIGKPGARSTRSWRKVVAQTTSGQIKLPESGETPLVPGSILNLIAR